jgi:hypothetical protein
MILSLTLPGHLQAQDTRITGETTKATSADLDHTKVLIAGISTSVYRLSPNSAVYSITPRRGRGSIGGRLCPGCC